VGESKGIDARWESVSCSSIVVLFFFHFRINTFSKVGFNLVGIFLHSVLLCNETKNRFLACFLKFTREEELIENKIGLFEWRKKKLSLLSVLLVVGKRKAPCGS
jgi:hypothetical protein